MSHTTTIRGIKITDVNALNGAVKELAKGGMKIALLKDAKPRSYSTNQSGMGVADYVIQLGDATYDVGLYKQEDGSYQPRTDFYNGSVARVLGGKASKKGNEAQAQLGKLFQMYGVVAATNKARLQGYTVRRMVNKESGQIKLEVMGFA